MPFIIVRIHYFWMLLPLLLISFVHFEGACIDLVNNYTYNCYVGFTGSNCDVKMTYCTVDACYPNVTCLANNDTIGCGPCPLGLSGDGKNCEGNVATK